MSEENVSKSAELIALGEVKGQMKFVIDFIQTIGPVMAEKASKTEVYELHHQAIDRIKIVEAIVEPLKTKEKIRQIDKRRIEWVVQVLPSIISAALGFFCAMGLHASVHILS